MVCRLESRACHCLNPVGTRYPQSILWRLRCLKSQVYTFLKCKLKRKQIKGERYKERKIGNKEKKTTFNRKKIKKGEQVLYTKTDFPTAKQTNGHTRAENKETERQNTRKKG